GAGGHGGNVVAEGTMEEIVANPNSLTGQYSSGVKEITVPKDRAPRDPKKTVELLGATGNNLKNVNLSIPVGLFSCITGVSGSGKSTLINDTFFKIAHTQLNGATTAQPSPYK
ncbi:excinuclease ABC subunit UvrA, partial [Vibrio parahaemolyticus]|nr:excinuclease ABC subunit UvrA [Vibrio parahaemolyticus]